MHYLKGIRDQDEAVAQEYDIPNEVRNLELLWERVKCVLAESIETLLTACTLNGPLLFLKKVLVGLEAPATSNRRSTFFYRQRSLY